jgi:hypothetical protein
MTRKARRTLGMSLILAAVAILVGGALVMRSYIESTYGVKETRRHAGASATIRAFSVGAGMVDVQARLGPPDEMKSDGPYMRWIYWETITNEGWERSGLSLRHLQEMRRVQHQLLFRNGELLFAAGSAPEVGDMTREVHVAMRRLRDPFQYPPILLSTGGLLHTAMSTIVDGTTTLEEVERLFGSPAERRQQGALIRLVYRLPTAVFALDLKDGVVVDQPYSRPGTEEDQAVRELFYPANTWPDVAAPPGKK